MKNEKLNRFQIKLRYLDTPFSVEAKEEKDVLLE